MVLGPMLSLAGSLLGRGKLSILIYHQVLATPDPMRPSEPTQAVFAWQMELLARYFTPLPLEDAVRRLAADELPRNAVCVTFDDGYRNNLSYAQPILARYGIPATVFVATGFVGGPNMWNDRVIHLFGEPGRTRLCLGSESVTLGDWGQRRQLAQDCLHRLKYLPVRERDQAIDAMYLANACDEQGPLMMDWNEIRELYAHGISLGAHTVNHPILKELPEADQRREIVEGRKHLEEAVQSSVTQFAYPNGKYGTDFDDVAVDIVQTEGFTTAVSTDWGVSTLTTSPWRLRRFTPWDRSPSRFQARLHLNQLGRA